MEREDGLSPETCLTKIWIVSSEEREREERRLEEVEEDIVVADGRMCLGGLDMEGVEARRGDVRRWSKPVMLTAGRHVDQGQTSGGLLVRRCRA